MFMSTAPTQDHDHTSSINNIDATTKPLVVVIAGVTGSGKSAVAAELCATSRHGIIVSADSVQAYRGVQIGSNKPDAAERARTPHILLDVVDHTAAQHYNAADWRNDALFVIRELLQGNETWQTSAIGSSGTTSKDADLSKPNDETSEVEHSATTVSAQDEERRRYIWTTIQAAKQAKQQSQSGGDNGVDNPKSSSFLPVVVGGTMMYLAWLVHGQPDAARPTREAQRLSDEQLSMFHANNDWEGATKHVMEHGQVFTEKVKHLGVNDWYRLGRLLEVALTVKDNSQAVEQLYSGLREGGLSSLGYDVRCFFLCPDDRMKHTKTMDRRCEEMIIRGLLKETADLTAAGEMPEMAARAIGYRQSLDYLQRENSVEGDDDAFQAYLEEFTGATRRYGKRQMQWFRKDEEFVFVPVSSVLSEMDRIKVATEEMTRLINLARSDFDHERTSPESLSSKTRADNEAQGKGMKFYQFKTQILHPGSMERQNALSEADASLRTLRQSQN